MLKPHGLTMKFFQAAELGNKRLLMLTIGVVITTDGSFGEIPRVSYKVSEARTIEELKQLGNLIVVLNTIILYSSELLKLQKR